MEGSTLKMNELEKKFGIEQMPSIKKDLPLAEDDFRFVRENLIETIKKSEEAIEALSQLADQSQAARYYEALATHFGKMVDANKALLDIQRQIRQINAENQNAPKTTVNNLYVGTSDDLLKIIKKAKNDGRMS